MFVALDFNVPFSGVFVHSTNSIYNGEIRDIQARCTIHISLIIVVLLSRFARKLQSDLKKESWILDKRRRYTIHNWKWFFGSIFLKWRDALKAEKRSRFSANQFDAKSAALKTTGLETITWRPPLPYLMAISDTTAVIPLSTSCQWLTRSFVLGPACHPFLFTRMNFSAI